MSKKKTSEMLRKISHLRLMIPCMLVAALVFDGLMGYTMPDYFDGLEAAPQKVYAAETPELEELAQTGEKLESKGPAGNLAKIDESGEYKDGVYTGSAQGFGGAIKVQVTITDGKIASIVVLSASGETSSFFSRAKAVIGRILKKQSTNVDAVSGATYSSNGIIKAVRNALAKAKKKSNGKSDKSRKRSKKDDKSSGNEELNPVKPETVNGGIWKDGAYTGEGEGFGGKLHVQVTIENGKVTDIVLLDSLDGEEFINKAKTGIFTSALKNQGTEVDSVTGATYSSRGLIEAINDALSKASYEPANETGNNSREDSVDNAQVDGAGGTGQDTGNTTTEKAYKDGTYTSTVACTRSGWFDYDIDITLIIKDGRLDSLSVYKGSDYTEDEYDREENDACLDMAVNGYGSRTGMISRILEAQNADVDTVTGATYSSEAIRSGVSEILSGIEIEKKPEENSKTDEDQKMDKDPKINEDKKTGKDSKIEKAQKFNEAPETEKDQKEAESGTVIDPAVSSKEPANEETKGENKKSEISDLVESQESDIYSEEDESIYVANDAESDSRDTENTESDENADSQEQKQDAFSPPEEKTVPADDAGIEDREE